MKKIKHIGIFGTLDAFANSVRPLEIKKYLENLGYQVTIIDDDKIYNGPKNNTVLKKANIMSKLARTGFNLFDKNVIGLLYYYYFLSKLETRTKILNNIIANNSFDLLIFENHIQAYAAKYIKNIPYILDLDSPLADELYYSGKLDKLSYNLLVNKFKSIYAHSTYINFQWYLYSDYVKKHIYSGENFIEVNFGNQPKEINLHAKYNKKPKIICLGYLGGKWVNLPLLSNLSKHFEIDVYGGPEPDKKLNINYKGYAPTTEILKDYQYGLITISKDKLRQSSFSSKHLEYISYGLPVLTPDWRKDKLLDKTSIYYNETNFLDKIKEYSDQTKWDAMSKECLKTSSDFKWENILKPLGKYIEEIEK